MISFVGSVQSVFGIEQKRPPVNSSSFFSVEKITRLVLRILSLFVASAAVFLGSYALIGNMSAKYLFCALGLFTASTMIWAKASEIVDLNDPAELKKLKEGFAGQTMTEMLKKYPLETIIRYDIVSLDCLRTRCCVNLLKRKEHPLPTLRQNATELLKHKIITSEICHALKQDDVEKLNELVPNNANDLEKMFQNSK